MSKHKYPDFISELSDDGRSIFYVISKEPGYYKFGITYTLKTRMKTHYRDFQFTKIHAIIDCGCDATMRAVETEFKQECAKRGYLVTRYGKTEVMCVQDISPFLPWVNDKIKQLNALPQPPNNRGAAKARKESELKSQVDLWKQLHEQDKKEIEVLQEKVRLLEKMLLE